MPHLPRPLLRAPRHTHAGAGRLIEPGIAVQAGLIAAAPFLIGAGGPAYSGKPVAADKPFGTLTTENHRAVVMPVLAPMRGTKEDQLGGHSVERPLSTISAGGIHHAAVGAHLVTIGYGERSGQRPRTHDLEAPLGTVVAGGIKQALVAGTLVDMGHGESCNTGA